MAVLSGTFQPGGKITFELPLEVDLCTKINLRVRLAPITFTPSANLLYARYVDFVGLNMIDEVRLRFGTEKLQTVSRDEIFCKMMSYYADEEKYNLMKLVGGGMTPAQRDDAATSDQEIIIPLLTLLGVHLCKSLLFTQSAHDTWQTETVTQLDVPRDFNRHGAQG